MSTGSHSGRLFQTLPTHMGAWSKYVLGWVEPEGAGVRSRRAERDARPGLPPAQGHRGRGARSTCRTSTSRSASRTAGSSLVELGNDQSWADVRLTRSIDVPAGGDVRFWTWDDYTIEELWDYGFIEVSTDGGATWNQLEVFDEAGQPGLHRRGPEREPGRTVRRAGERADRRHRRLPARLRQPDAVRRDHDPAAAALRHRRRRSRSAAGSPTTSRSPRTAPRSGPTTSRAGPTAGRPSVGSFTDTTGAGWVRTNGTFDYEQYYLAEWRNLDGYDNGLKTPYATNYKVGFGVEREPDAVQRARSADLAPGLVELVQRRRQQPVRSAEHRREGNGAAGRRALRTGAAPRGGGRGQPEPAGQPARRVSRPLTWPSAGRALPVPVLRTATARRPYALACNKFGRAIRDAFTDAKTWYPGSSTGPTSIRRSRCSSATWTPRPSCRRGATRSTRPGSWIATAACCRAVRHPIRRRSRARHRQPAGRPAGRRRGGPGHHGRPVPRRRIGVVSGPAGTTSRSVVVVRPGHRRGGRRRRAGPGQR